MAAEPRACAFQQSVPAWKGIRSPHTPSVLYMLGVYTIKVRVWNQNKMLQLRVGCRLRVWALLNPSSWAARWDLVGEGDPHFQKNVLGIIREHPGGEDWKVTSFLHAPRGRGCSEGLGRWKSELKSLIIPPRTLQDSSSPSWTQTQSRALPCPACASPAGEGRTRLVLLIQGSGAF